MRSLIPRTSRPLVPVTAPVRPNSGNGYGYRRPPPSSTELNRRVRDEIASRDARRSPTSFSTPSHTTLREGRTTVPYYTSLQADKPLHTIPPLTSKV